MRALDALEAEGEIVADADSRARVVAEPPKDARFGDVSTNAAMTLAKANRANPRALAEKIAERLRRDSEVEDVAVEGPGFVNMRLTDAARFDAFMQIFREREAYGRSNVGAGAHIGVEFVSANPTGPMHIGHARGAVYGDALVRVMKRAGYKVTAEYYINDAGGQIDVLADSAYHRYLEALGENPGALPEGCYPGDYVRDLAKTLAEKYGDFLKAMPEKERRALLRVEAPNAMMGMIKDDLEALDVSHDLYVSERALLEDGRIDAVIQILDEKKLLYRGVLEPPKGKRPDDWEPREQLLFASTRFGDDVDRALMKSDGSHTYFAGDAAYHADKVARGYDALCIVLGADHGGYVSRLKAVVSALSGGKVELDVKIMQIVRYIKEGKPLKMSKRAGAFETVRDVIDEFGKDAVRYMMLTRKGDATLDFDVDLVREKSKDNPVFYVQYAYARISSVLKYAEDKGFAPALSDVTAERFVLLSSDEEKTLVRLLAEWPRVLEQAAASHEPHRVAGYAHDLAQAFHALWSKGNDNADMRFIVESDPEATAARLTLAQATRYVLLSLFDTLGVTAREEM
ncbi:MAG: arginine--tRNA ligase [Rickettsiales bacterium]